MTEFSLKETQGANEFNSNSLEGSGEEGLKQILHSQPEASRSRLPLLHHPQNHTDTVTGTNGKKLLMPGKTIDELFSLKTSFSESSQYTRSIRKDGRFNWSAKSIGRHRHRFIDDLFTMMVEIQWRILVLIFCAVYFGSWIVFAGIWYLILYFHGDLMDENYKNSSWTPCITELNDFTGAFLFSVETQHTTGYGFYHLTENCSSTIITFCLQSILGCIIEGVMVGILFVKISRGKRRTATILFSKVGVINRCFKTGKLFFMFRIADLRNKSNLAETKIRAQLITRVRGAGIGSDLRIGEFLIKREELKVSADGETGKNFFLFWPTTIIHEINLSSPLYKFFNKTADADSRNTDPHFEIIVVLEGVTSNGQMSQKRSSYIPSEIYWSQAFKPMSLVSKNSQLQIDFADFDEIQPVT